MLSIRKTIHEFEEGMVDWMSLSWTREPSKRRMFRTALCNESQRGEAHPCSSEILKRIPAGQCAVGSLPKVRIGEEFHIGSFAPWGEPSDAGRDVSFEGN